MDTVSLFRPVTKFSAEIDSGAAVSEVVANAFRVAESGRPGASFISAPQDVMTGETGSQVLTPVNPVPLGPADAESVRTAATLINRAHCPVLLLGMLASQPSAATGIRQLVGRTKLPVVCTYQGAGVVSQELFDCFGGRVGLFHTQPGDKLLDAADLVITIGYDPVEYDPSLWNHGFKRDIIHIDVLPSDIDKDYKPAIELTGSISATVDALTNQVTPRTRGKETVFLGEIAQQRKEFAGYAIGLHGSPIHPARLTFELQSFLSEDTTVCLDMGSFHIWLARHLYSFRPRQILMTNGQQTLGVAVPWGIAASLVRPNEKIISISGDGGFLFSAMELETAVRLKCNLVHLVWIDGHYDMVRFQEVAKYGRSSGVDFGPVNFVKLAESFGAGGLKIDHPDEIGPTLKKALAMEGPVVVAIPVDYRDNHRLMEILRPDVLN
jgi:acetolactate synthase-1/2/3 large subunit